MDLSITVLLYPTQAALMLDSGRLNFLADTDKIQHLLAFVRGSPLHFNREKMS